MARPRTGSLYLTKSGWRARVTITIDGVAVQKSFDLETKDKQVARIKLKKLLEKLASGIPIEEAPQEAARVETFEEAARRIVLASGIKTAKSRLDRLKKRAFPAFGKKLVTDIVAGDVRALLDDMAKKECLDHQTCLHMRNDISAVLDDLWRHDIIRENVCKKVKIPKEAKRDRRERAVLDESDLITYLAWSHPNEAKQAAVLERQTAGCVSWFFGGLRWGDIRKILWEAFEIDGGRFPFGWAPRVKTARPQKLEVPDVLRPILRDYWERAGRPTKGLIFPVSRGKRKGEERAGGSMAKAMRRDLARAFGFEAPLPSSYLRSNGRADTRTRWQPTGRKMNERERELLTETKYTRPLDFHGFRRAFKQGLRDADVDVQQAMRLSGATDMAAHARYLSNTGKAARIPAAALPSLGLSMAPAETREG